MKKSLFFRGIFGCLFSTLVPVLLLAPMSGNCSDDKNAASSSGLLLERGTSGSDTTYHHIDYYCAPLDKTLKLYYYIPETGSTQNMHILFAIAGSTRQAEYQITSWKDIADERGIMVFSPLFTRADFPGNRAYQYAGISLQDESYDPVEPDKWSVRLIEGMFDSVRYKTASKRPTYDIWGHSAGSQFTHRLMFFVPQARIRMAVASNAGSYMIPSLEGYSGGEWDFPHSLRMTNGDFTRNDIHAYFAKPLVVHVGTADIEVGPGFPSLPAAMAQGPTRYGRGIFFYEYARQAALEAGVPFNWRIVEVEGVPHSSRRMVQTPVTGAADILYPNR